MTFLWDLGLKAVQKPFKTYQDPPRDLITFCPNINQNYLIFDSQSPKFPTGPRHCHGKEFCSGLCQPVHGRMGAFTFQEMHTQTINTYTF